MNTLDHLKDLTPEQVKNFCQNNAIDAAVAMANIQGDYNLSTLVRNCNFFGLREAFYFGGKKHWDRRGSVGTHHYTDLSFLRSEEDFIQKMKEDGRSILAVENNIPQYSDKTFDAFETFAYNFTRPVFVFGEEGRGLSDYVLDNSDGIVTIKAYGSVRSLNVGTTSGIILALYRKNYDYQVRI